MLLEMLVNIPFKLTRSDRKCSLLLITFGQRSRVCNGSSSSQRWRKVECGFNEVVPTETGEGLRSIWSRHRAIRRALISYLEALFFQLRTARHPLSGL